MFLLLGCLVSTAYTPTVGKTLIPPSVYFSSPDNRDSYCEEALVYAEGWTLEEVKFALYGFIRDENAAALIEVKIWKDEIVSTGNYNNPMRQLYAGSAIMITWGPCR